MLDVAPRVLSVQDVNMLCNFAELAVRELERQRVVCSVVECCSSGLVDCMRMLDTCAISLLMVHNLRHTDLFKAAVHSNVSHVRCASKLQ